MVVAVAGGDPARPPPLALMSSDRRPAGCDLLVWVVLAAAAIAGAARLIDLGTPPALVFDEVYYVPAARQVLAGQEVMEERTHPPLSKLIIAASIRLVGDRPAGWRAASAVAGVALLVVVYALARALFADRTVAAIAALLAALDGLIFVESRIAKPDVFLALFVSTAYWAFWRALTPARLAKGPLALAGIAAGAALATKWTAAAPLGGLAVVWVLARGRRGQAPWRAELATLLVALGVLPVVVYLLTYLPFLRSGHTLADVVAQQRWMLAFHAGLTQGHPYQSPWWSWPLLVRPIWYEYREVAPQVARGILAIGNPVVWWALLPAVVAATVGAVRAGGAPERVLLVGGALAWGQYAFVPRVLFLYHFLLPLPFGVLLVARGLGRARTTVGGGVVVAYLALAAAWFAAFFPLLAGRPIAVPHYQRLMWFRTWI